jgi:asparagine synthase (glutamine-hydrolysing)
MSVTIAALNKSGEDVSSTLVRMLKSAFRRQDSIVGIANNESWEISYGIPEFTSLVSSRLVAHISFNPLIYPPQPLVQTSGAFAFDGFIYDSERPDTLEAADILEKDLGKGLEALINERETTFTAVATDDKEIFCARDHVGAVPLYFGENEEIIAVSSNMKSLWVENIKPNPVNPGSIVRITDRGVKSKTIKRVVNPETIECTLGDVVEKLDNIFTDIAHKIAGKTSEGCLAFSGGIDSTLAAYYLKEAGIRLDLVCFGVGDRPEFMFAEKSADFLGLPLENISISSSFLSEALPEIILSIEESDPMNVAIGVPLFFSAKKAADMGYIKMFSGNGSDEVFGGYMKYLKIHLEGGDSSESMYLDTINSWRNNFDRDHKICTDQGLDLILPFTSPRLINYGLSIPLRYKIPDLGGELRKIALRTLADKLGIPPELSRRPKKAAQYSTGVMKTLTKIAKENGKVLHEYLEDLLNKEKRN